MIKIGNTIIEEDIKEEDVTRKRQTVRAVIINDGKVCMLHSTLYNDYMFPGGGVKEDEDHKEALVRELREEIGAKNINVIKPIGYTEEIRYGINSTNNVYKQTSYFYLCEVGGFTKPKLVGREKLQGLTTVFINPQTVIDHNEVINNERISNDEKGFKTVLIRENLILKYIMEHMI